jgi:two-component system, NtrC family, sensor kinase
MARTLPSYSASMRSLFVLATRSRSWLLVAAAVGVVIAAGVWDSNQEAEAALVEVEAEQSAFASIVAAHLGVQLAAIRAEAVLRSGGCIGSESLTPPSHYQRVRAGEDHAPLRGDALWVTVRAEPHLEALVDTQHLLAAVSLEEVGQVLLRPPGSDAFLSAAGQRFSSDVLRQAATNALVAIPLDRAQAAELGLPERGAIAGLAHADSMDGRWEVAVIASIGPERDRHARARIRLLGGVLLTGALMLALGAYGSRAERKQRTMAAELEHTELDAARNEELERVSRAATMVTFATGVAHEIATPLGVIHGRAEQLLERAKDSRDASAAQRILEQSSRIEEVIRGFLTLARGGAPDLQRLAPADVAHSAQHLVEHRLARAAVSHVLHIEDRLPKVRGDRRLLEHALTNLLLNASDACGRGGRIDVRVVRRQDWVEFAVSDDGPGMTKEQIDQAREPFFSTKAPGMGTGIGLSIAHEIAKIHRGSLALEPRSPRGLLATLRIPAIAGEDDGPH